MEIVSGILENAEHVIAEGLRDADLLVIFTCTVKTPTQRKILKRLKHLRKRGIPIIIAGCMPKAQKDLLEANLPEASMIGPDTIDQIIPAVEGTLEGRRFVSLDGITPDRTCLPRVRRNEVINILPISSGCLGNCSYCIVKYARGHLTSFPPDKIRDDVMNSLAEGCREIWITAEDTAAYNWGEVRLPQLMDLITDIEGEFRVRIGMMTPNHLESNLDELIETYKDDKIFKFLHIPVQSGSNQVLERMRRRYRVEDFRYVVQRFREAFPKLTLSTDIICGFPGETEEQFESSLNLVREIKPEVLNISRFWSRPGTDAAKMSDKIHGRITKERSKELTKIWRSIALEKGEKWVGWRGEVLVDDNGKEGDMMGRNQSYRPVAFPSEADLGSFVEVEVLEAKVGYLLGREI
jgi:MiaB-like tRNA modifying enzyme